MSTTTDQVNLQGRPSVGARGVLRLTNGMEIVCQTSPEAQFLYHDIFEKEVYIRHGISLEGVECVLDVGANIGLFTLFVGQHCPGTRVYSFEPAPPLFELLRENVERHGVDARLFNCGISESAGTAELTFYPNSSGMSSFHANLDEEKQALYNVLVNQLRSGEPGMEDIMKHADDLLEERLRSCTFECQLYSLSDIIREHDIRRVDLLKIDVQKSELDVIRGIEDEHWPRIRQIVLELHNTSGQFHWLRDFLDRHGFYVLAEQEDAYQESAMLNVFASRSTRGSMTSSLGVGVKSRQAEAVSQAESRAAKMKSLYRRQKRNPSICR